MQAKDNGLSASNEKIMDKIEFVTKTEKTTTHETYLNEPDHDPNSYETKISTKKKSTRPIPSSLLKSTKCSAARSNNLKVDGKATGITGTLR